MVNDADKCACGNFLFRGDNVGAVDPDMAGLEALGSAFGNLHFGQDAALWSLLGHRSILNWARLT